MSTEAVEMLARRMLTAEDALRDARNGLGHPNEPHDQALWSGPFENGLEIHDLIGDCSACAGAQYGCEHDLTEASVALRIALGIELQPWQRGYAEL